METNGDTYSIADPVSPSSLRFFRRPSEQLLAQLQSNIKIALAACKHAMARHLLNQKLKTIILMATKNRLFACFSLPIYIYARRKWHFVEFDWLYIANSIGSLAGRLCWNAQLERQRCARWWSYLMTANSIKIALLIYSSFLLATQCFGFACFGHKKWLRREKNDLRIKCINCFVINIFAAENEEDTGDQTTNSILICF